TDELVCAAGKVCCDVPPIDDSPTRLSDELDEPSCDGVCVVNPSECAGEIDNDESGKDFIDVRNIAASSCPADQYCCRASVDVPACDATCQPLSRCLMPVAGGGCSEENVCCRMDRTSWFEMINDINGMADPDPVVDRSSVCEWRKLREDGTRIPPWLVSVWAKVEIIPGLQTDQFVCSGVLVDPSLVLTTASNVKHVPVEKLFANVGDYDISSRSALQMENVSFIAGFFFGVGDLMKFSAYMKTCCQFLSCDYGQWPFTGTLNGVGAMIMYRKYKVKI
uniref:Peptidase S1 domain-containing protein n=1 Tax=Anopheles maculatus TaxID=74869 RepID=A0A182SZ63_9DIPT